MLAGGDDWNVSGRFFEYDRLLYFTNNDNTLCSVEGTTVHKLATIGSYQFGFFGYKDKIYFSGPDSVYSYRLRTYNISTGGVENFKHLYADGWDSCYSFTVLNGKLYFRADKYWATGSLFVTDGTESGTTVIKKVGYDNNQFITYANKLFFWDRDTTAKFQKQLFCSDGTVAGTRAIKPAGYDGGTHWGNDFFIFKNALYFTASYDSLGLWKVTDNQSEVNITARINSNFSIYPTIASSTIHFSRSFRNAVTIVSVLGQTIITKRIEDGGDLDVSGLNPGLYIVRAEDGATAKFIKQ
jgi:hypothetical protein